MKMKGTVQKMLILAVGIIGFVLIAGCQESATTRLSSSKTGGPADAKKSRLVAAESMELKKQLARYDKQIEKLKEQHSKEIKRQQELLAKCQKEKKVRQEEKIDESAKGQMDELTTFIVELNAKLQEENENLKSQIEELKAQLSKVQQGEKPKEREEVKRSETP
jgi:outer membrane murein-binding lipoprotein Lpp